MTQIVATAGLFYLLNKIFFAFAEVAQNGEWERRWKISAWISYIVGLCPWLIVFYKGEDHIAFWVELAGLPSMILGLTNAIKKKEQGEPYWLKYIALVITLVGFAVSFRLLEGFNQLTQLLEFFLAIGFLGGTFLLSRKKRRPEGYLFFVVMNGSNAWLQNIRSNDLLMQQQTFSLAIMIFAYWLTQWRQKKENQ